MSTCLTNEQFEMLVAGERDVGSATAEHLEACPNCRQRLEKAVVTARGDSLADIRAAWTASRIDAPAPRVVSRSVRSEDTDGQAELIPGYEIIREIHRGGQGVVYEAVQHSTGRTVAVKVLLEGPLAGERARWRFERE